MSTTADANAIDARGRRLLLLAKLLWIVMAVALGVKTLLDPVAHSAYPFYESAAKCWWQGKDPYQENIASHKSLPSGKAGWTDRYRYGPLFAAAAGIVAFLPSPLGALVWSWLNLGICYASIGALARRILPGLDAPGREALFLGLTLLGGFHVFWPAQTNLLVFSLVALGAIAILDERWWLAALLLAIPAHIKVWPLAAGLLMAACWPRRLAWRLPLALAVVGAVPFLLQRPTFVWGAYRAWWDMLRGPCQIRHVYRDAWTVWELVAPPVNPRLYLLLQLVAAGVALGLCLWQVSRKISALRTLLVVLVAWTTWQLLFGPGTERDTFGLIAPLTSWGMVTSLHEKRGRWLMGLSFLLLVAGYSGDLERLVLPWIPWFQAVHPMGVMLFFAWFVYWNCAVMPRDASGDRCGFGRLG
jgi:hypothetical protein